MYLKASALAEAKSPFARLHGVISQVKDSLLPMVPVPYGVIPCLHGSSLQCWLLEVMPVAQQFIRVGPMELFSAAFAF